MNLFADLRKEHKNKSSGIKINPLKGKRRKKEVLKGTKKLTYEGSSRMLE